MAVRRRPTLIDLFRAEPTKSALLAGGPLVLAAGQLANGYVNDVSPAITGAFALAMIAFATVATDHQAAEHRRRRLERDLEA
jgi:hypothetical protein